ncbi:hypothetical protein BWI92_00945 [Flectobacillus sp. BAB-3569]|nr:hypothetical protein BWI92_00945 [Flectobacillus sp. BAB-3569]
MKKQLEEGQKIWRTLLEPAKIVSLTHQNIVLLIRFLKYYFTKPISTMKTTHLTYETERSHSISEYF